jgi:hypothetical protein
MIALILGFVVPICTSRRNTVVAYLLPARSSIIKSKIAIKDYITIKIQTAPRFKITVNLLLINSAITNNAIKAIYKSS